MLLSSSMISVILSLWTKFNLIILYLQTQTFLSTFPPVWFITSDLSYFKLFYLMLKQSHTNVVDYIVFLWIKETIGERWQCQIYNIILETLIWSKKVRYQSFSYAKSVYFCEFLHCFWLARNTNENKQITFQGYRHKSGPDRYKSGPDRHK